jgi:hypothetical protein
VTSRLGLSPLAGSDFDVATTEAALEDEHRARLAAPSDGDVTLLGTDNWAWRSS